MTLRSKTQHIKEVKMILNQSDLEEQEEPYTAKDWVVWILAGAFVVGCMWVMITLFFLMGV